MCIYMCTHIQLFLICMCTHIQDVHGYSAEPSPVVLHLPPTPSRRVSLRSDKIFKRHRRTEIDILTHPTAMTFLMFQLRTSLFCYMWRYILCYNANMCVHMWPLRSHIHIQFLLIYTHTISYMCVHVNVCIHTFILWYTHMCIYILCV